MHMVVALLLVAGWALATDGSGSETLQWASQPTMPGQTVATTVTVDVSLDAATSPFPHFWEAMFGSGHGALTLRSDWQRAATQATEELGLKAVRFHGLFDEDMSILTRDPTGALVYNWSSIDQSFDFMLKVGMTPKLELSFFPAVIADCTAFMPTMGEHGTVVNPGHEKCKQGFFYGGIMTVPSNGYDESGWVEFVSAFAKHITDRYGASEILKWRFEVWNELGGLTWDNRRPQLGINTSYMTLWNATATAIKSVDPRYKVGGPATEQLGHITDFVNECTTNSLPCDFVSSHLYPSDPQCPQTNETWDPSCFSRLVKEARAKVPPAMEFFVTEMSVTVRYPEHGTTNCSGCDQHDTSAAAAFIFRVLGEISGPQTPDGMSWWTFSDIFQEHNISRVMREQGLPQTEFSSAYGLQTINGVRKPAWRAFELAHQGGDLKVDSVTSTENASSPFHAFATTVGSGAPDRLSSLMVFLSLWENPYDRGPPHHTTRPQQLVANRSVTLIIPHDAASGSLPSAIWSTRIDEQHANPQAAWKAMGSPAQPSPSQLQALHAASALQPQQLRFGSHCRTPVESATCLNVTVELAPNTAVLLSFNKPRVV